MAEMEMEAGDLGFQPPSAGAARSFNIPGVSPAVKPPTGGSGTISDILSQLTDVVPKMKAMRSPDIEQGIRQNIAMQRGLALSPNPPMPEKAKIQDVPQKPEFTFRDTMQAFQNPGVVLSMIASVFTRNPLTAALKAGAAAMQGFHQGDKELYEKSKQDWKDNLDAALKQNSIEIERYREALEERSTTISEKMAKITALASANRDMQMLATMENGDLSRAFQFIQQREAQQQRLQSARDMAEDRRDRLAETQRHNLETETIQRQNANTAAQKAAGGLGAGQGGLKTRDERDRKRFIDLSVKAANEGLTAEEQLEFDDIVQGRYKTKNLVAGQDVVTIQPNVPTLKSGVAQPAPASPATAGEPIKVDPNAPKTTTQTLANGARMSRTGPPKDPPAAAEGHMIDNASKIKEAERTLDEIEKYAGAFGWGRYAASFLGDIGQAWYDQRDPKGVAARAAAGRLAAIQIHDLSGAAVTVGEAPRFRPFVPTPADDAATTIKKIEQLKAQLRIFLQEQYNAYGPDAGYKTQPSIEAALRDLEVAPSAGSGGKASAAPAKADRTTELRGMTYDQLLKVDENTLTPNELGVWIDETEKKRKGK